MYADFNLGSLSPTIRTESPASLLSIFNQLFNSVYQCYWKDYSSNILSWAFKMLSGISKVDINVVFIEWSLPCPKCIFWINVKSNHLFQDRLKLFIESHSWSWSVFLKFGEYVFVELLTLSGSQIPDHWSLGVHVCQLLWHQVTSFWSVCLWHVSPLQQSRHKNVELICNDIMDGHCLQYTFCYWMKWGFHFVLVVWSKPKELSECIFSGEAIVSISKFASTPIVIYSTAPKPCAHLTPKLLHIP